MSVYVSHVVTVGLGLYLPGSCAATATVLCCTPLCEELLISSRSQKRLQCIRTYTDILLSSAPGAKAPQSLAAVAIPVPRPCAAVAPLPLAAPSHVLRVSARLWSKGLTRRLFVKTAPTLLSRRLLDYISKGETSSLLVTGRRIAHAIHLVSRFGGTLSFVFLFSVFPLPSVTLVPLVPGSSFYTVSNP